MQTRTLVLLENGQERKYDGKSLTQERKMELMEYKNKEYLKLLERMSADDVAVEVRSTLDELRKKGYGLAVGSSSKNAKFILDRVQLTDYFDAISDGNNITFSKPDPEVFLKASEMLCIAPQKCIVVEDARAGIDAAILGRMRTIGIGDAAHYEKTDFAIQKFTDILEVERKFLSIDKM